MSLRIELADLKNVVHQAAIIALLDMYCRDELGDAKPLSDEAREGLMPGLQRHGGARVYLAYEGQEPLGLAICFVGFSTFRGKPLVNIHDLAVSPESRGQGIGRKLLAAIEADARALGCCKVTLEVRTDNARAMGLYRSAGFEPGQPEMLFWSQKLA